MKLRATDIGTVTVPRGLWWRVHSSAFEPNAFNASPNGNARFSPIYDTSGAVIPTMYVGSTPAVALMETVLHDAPSPSAGFILTLPSSDKEVRRAACLVSCEPLLVADFSALGLRRLGLKKSDVIDSEKCKYPLSRDLATQVHALMPNVQGIQWASRQDDRGSAMVIFGQRLKRGGLRVWHGNEPVFEGVIFDELLDLLERLDAEIGRAHV